jgi:hypothetical protein
MAWKSKVWCLELYLDLDDLDAQRREVAYVRYETRRRTDHW